MDPLAIEEYNRLTRLEYETIRDFLILHYHATERRDSPLWRACAAMVVPDTLQYKIDHFVSRARLVSSGIELFQNPSWLAVFVGQHVMPERYDAMVDHRTDVPGAERIEGLRRVIADTARTLPEHRDFIEKHCRAPAPPMAKAAM